VSILLAAILVLAAAVRLWALDFGLPYIQARPDETQVIDVTLQFLRGNLAPRFYDYPWLYMWVLTGLYLGYFLWGTLTGVFGSVADLVASWPVRWEPFFIISRALSAAAGTATVFVVFRLGRHLWGEAAGLAAAFFLSLTFLHVRDSHFGTTDAAMTMLIMVSVSLLMRAHATESRRTFRLAGVAAGLAAATKYNAVLLAVPILASQALHVIDSPGERLRAAFDGRVQRFGVPFALMFFVGIPFVLFDPEPFWIAMRELRHSMQYGTPNLGLDNGWVHHLRFSLRYGLGFPLLAAGLAGAAGLLLRAPRVGVLLLSFPVAYYLVAGSLRNLFFRYAIPVLPFLCLTAAYLLCECTRRIRLPGAQGSRVRSCAAAAVTAVAAVCLVLPSAVSTWRFNRVLSQTDNRVLVADWFDQNVPAGSSVLQSGSIYGYAQLDPQRFVQWRWDRIRRIFLVNQRPATGRPDWILVQDSPLPSATQEIVREWLRDGYAFAWQFTAFSPNGRSVYDQQDAFFVPFAGFDSVKRPGPNFSLYQRIQAPEGESAPSVHAPPAVR
jgi:4-amino-4-deoxy-L-arabinose transferase-like glycosyltransferase